MLSPLKFTQGAIAKKDYVPALTHFRIKNGSIMGYNGAVALSSPIDIDIDCYPVAKTFTRAIQTCEETIQLHLTASKKLAISSGPFKAFIDCLPEDGSFPNIQPEGIEVPVDGQILVDCLRTLEPFISQDASREWSQGVLFRGQSAYATNNVVIVERWLGARFPDLNIPATAVREIIRIGDPPKAVHVLSGSDGSQKAITFLYPAGQWLRSSLLTLGWPDVSRILDLPSSASRLPKGFFEALEKLIPFIGDQQACIFSSNKISTEKTDGYGASFDVKDFQGVGAFNAKLLLELKPIIQEIDFTCFPKPSMFFGDNLRGVISGIHLP